MKIIPAIDILDGKCVRLFQGDFTKINVINDNPVAVAQNWEAMGAELLHIVDLNGAKDGNMKNYSIIQEITEKIGIPIQIGGGIRNMKVFDTLISLGVCSIILGTNAIENEPFLIKTVEKYKKKVIVSLDGKNGKLATRGWQNITKYSVAEIAKKLESIGITSFIYTDILKDGTLTQPDFKAVRRLRTIIKGQVIVSGGITTNHDIQILKQLGIDGVIVGKAFYENKLNFKEVYNAY